jgi:hypothetical protein
VKEVLTLLVVIVFWLAVAFLLYAVLGVKVLDINGKYD